MFQKSLTARRHREVAIKPDMSVIDIPARAQQVMGLQSMSATRRASPVRDRITAALFMGYLI